MLTTGIIRGHQLEHGHTPPMTALPWPPAPKGWSRKLNLPVCTWLFSTSCKPKYTETQKARLKPCKQISRGTVVIKMIVDLLFFLHDGTGERGNTQKLSQLYRNKELSIPAKGNREQASSHPNEQTATAATGSRAFHPQASLPENTGQPPPSSL